MIRRGIGGSPARGTRGSSPPATISGAGIPGVDHDDHHDGGDSGQKFDARDDDLLDRGIGDRHVHVVGGFPQVPAWELR
jgi:hypothetical protein